MVKKIFYVLLLTSFSHLTDAMQPDSPTIELTGYLEALEECPEGEKLAIDQLTDLAGKLDKNNLKKRINSQDFLGETPLHIAAKRGWVDYATALLKYGAQLDLVEKLDWDTPLLTAMKSYQLLATNEQLKQYDLLGKPDGYLVDKDPTPVWKKIAEKFEKINDQNQQMVNCEQNPYFKLLKLFIDNGANINTKDRSGNTLLHLAIKFHAPLPVVTYLLKNKIGVNTPNKLGNGAIHYLVDYTAKESNYFTELVTYGANVNLQNFNGETLLHNLVIYLTQNPDEDYEGETQDPVAFCTVFAMLVRAYKADRTLKNKLGQTAWDVSEAFWKGASTEKLTKIPWTFDEGAREITVKELCDKTIRPPD